MSSPADRILYTKKVIFADYPPETEGSLVLFFPWLLLGTTGRPLVLGQVLLVGSQVTAETLDHLGVGRCEVLGFPNVLLQIV
jgi:hypothetical protein